MNRSIKHIQLEGSRQSSCNSVMNDRAVQSLESRRIRLERIATIVLADGFAETIPLPPEEEEDGPPGYVDTLESSGTLSTYTHTHNQGREKGEPKSHPQSKAERNHTLTDTPHLQTKPHPHLHQKTTPTFSPPPISKEKGKKNHTSYVEPCVGKIAQISVLLHPDSPIEEILPPCIERAIQFFRLSSWNDYSHYYNLSNDDDDDDDDLDGTLQPPQYSTTATTYRTINGQK